MANEQNLKVPTSKEARELGRKGGKASAKKRRERKQMQELARIVLDMPAEEGDLADIEGITFDDFPDRNLTIGELSVLAVAKKAKRGDIAAITFLRDTAGEQPVERVEVSGDVRSAADDIAAAVAALRAGGDD